MASARVLGAVVGVVGCLRGWLLHACTALEMGMGMEMEMESPVPGGCLVFSGAVMAVEGCGHELRA